MNGQWLGEVTGTNPGTIMVNFDDMGDHYQGIAFLIDNNGQLPIVVAFLKTTDKARSFRFKTLGIHSINPKTGLIDIWDNVKGNFPNVNFPKEAEVEGDWDEERLKVKWSTDIGTSGSTTAQLPKSKANVPSEYTPIPDVTDWESYKGYVSKLEGRKFLFRGQSMPWRLRTKFHRTGRADLGRFLTEDIQTLHKHLSARTRHIFNLGVGDENGAFFNLVQHHGYPTPLLDWTYSPYVAAFFAYREISNLKASEASDDKKVRIIIFDQQQWRKDFVQTMLLNVAFPYFSIMEFIAIDNERMIPQQAASSVTNIDDIESYISSKENAEKKYLRVIDLPVKERSKVMRELSFMGITAGALFPGLDGACEELKERFFNN